RECVIPADPGSESGAGAGIQGPTGFRVKHGMTDQNRRRYPAASRVVEFMGVPMLSSLHGGRQASQGQER
ncbi:hypothetical protein, partial [Candidatus Methylomirabilis sp.]|uniref:hypothetical protein n=1 Tax=Candidatus Methylomirabilis sp. TaxID=2032687 RepID=UPI003C7961DE